MTGHDNTTAKETTMTKYNAEQKKILNDGTKIMIQLRKLGTLEGHRQADDLGRRLADMVDAAR